CSRTSRKSSWCRSYRKRDPGKRRRCRSFGGITKPARRRSSTAERLTELRLTGYRYRRCTRFRRGAWSQGRLKDPIDRHLRDRPVILRHMLEGTKDDPQQVGRRLRGVGRAPCGRQAKLPQVSNEGHLEVEGIVRLLEVGGEERGHR